MSRDYAIQYIVNHLPNLSESDLKQVWVLSLGLHIFEVTNAVSREFDKRRIQKYETLFNPLWIK